MKKRLRGFVLRLFARYGWCYGERRVTPTVTGIGIYLTTFDTPSVADPVGLISRVLVFRWGTSGYAFWS